MRAAPILTSFNAGELSPALDGRVDIAKYASGCRVLQNFIPAVQGTAGRRPGSRFVEPTKGDGPAWLVEFDYSATQAYVIEFGDKYVRFFTDHGALLNGMSVYEVASPYSSADLVNPDGTFGLNVVQSGDVLYIAHQQRTTPPYKLVRYADTNWAFELYQPSTGPFLERNRTAVTLVADGQSGSVDLTASADLFTATDVGRLVRLEVENLVVPPWEAEGTYTAGDLCRSDGKTYKALNSKTAGVDPPVHEFGTAFDGQDGVEWEYQDSGYGIARITAVISATAAEAVVVSEPDAGVNLLPLHVTTGFATTRWKLGAWSDSTEYPAAVCFFRNRLFWFGRPRIWASVPNDYENLSGDFFGEVLPDCAIWTQLQAEDVNDILWATATTRLIIGTGGGEFVGGEITTTDPLGPANFKTERTSKHRVRAVQPVGVGSSLLYVQRAGRKLLSIDYSLEQDAFISTDLAVLANRITRSGIVDMAYQSEPHSVLWCVLGDGKLVGFTYNREQEVTGWHRHKIGGDGFVESVAVITGPDGSREDLWIVVRRTIDGQVRRYVEFVEAEWEGPEEDGTGGDAQPSAFYVDSGLTYSGPPTTTISGLDHLEGETVQILADGAVQPDKVVAGGAITLDRAASTVHVGLGYVSRLVTMRLEAGGNGGTAQGKTGRIVKCSVRFLDSLGGRVGLHGHRVDPISRRSPSTPMGQPQPFFTGDVDVDFPGDWEKECRVEVQQDQPLPMTVVAIMPEVNKT